MRLFDGSRTATVAVSAGSRTPRRSATALSAVSLLLILLGTGCGGVFNTGTLTPPTIIPLFPQTKLDGTCFPKFAVSLPVFGPAGSIPRVDAASHPNLTVTMMEINQQVLTPGSYALCGGSGVRLGPTRVWAYQTTDTNTGAVLGLAHWPAVTIVAQRGVATQVQYVNQLPSFNPSAPSGPGLVQGVLPFDQTIHWADPLQSHCAMQKPAGSQSAKMPDGKMAMGADHDNLVDFPNSRLQHQAGHLQLASYPMESSMPSSKGSNTKSSMESGMQSSTDPCRQQYYGPVPAAVHLHGAELDAAYDGGPDSWFTPNGLKGADYHTIGNPPPGSAIYEYPNSQEAGTLWFHDHALGTTRINVYAGLAGFYFLKDPDREPQGYPGGAYEIEMAVQDRSFDTNSQLYFAQQQIFPKDENYIINN
jgi:spore coat protein A, manganese oxidase